MKQQRAFEVVRCLIQAGHIKEFAQIFQYVCRSYVYKKMGINSQRFSRLINCPWEFKLREINILAHFFGVSPMTIMALIYGESAGITAAATLQQPVRPALAKV